MRIGIVGMPNAGKSSLFNALTRAGAEAANYPFTTVEPNVAVVPVQDERLDRLAELLHSHPVTYETIEFHDIAGLVRGAHQGEGLGNQFLGQHPRDRRDRARRARPRRRAGGAPRGTGGPARPTSTRSRPSCSTRTWSRPSAGWSGCHARRRRAIAPWWRRRRWLRELIAALQEGRPARTVPPPADAPDAMRLLQPLTAKPVLYVANVGEGEPLEVPDSVA